MARVRAATGADHSAFSRLFPELGVDDPVPDPTVFQADMLPTTRVAEDEDGRILGYVFFQVLRTTTYIRNLVTAPEARRQGIARALLAHVAAEARAGGCTHWALNVKPENVAAVRLYEAVGFRVLYRATSLRLAWSALDGVVPLPLREVRPEEDASGERATEEEAGLYAAQRRRGRIVLGSEADGAWRAIVVFHPTFPGAFPLFVDRAEDALGALATLRPLARSEREHVTITVHRRPDVVDTLLAAGAEVRMLIDQMKGELPT